MRYFNRTKIDTTDFDDRDISVNELYGMIDCASHTLKQPRSKIKRHERKLAAYLLKAAKWIEREAYFNGAGI